MTEPDYNILRNLGIVCKNLEVRKLQLKDKNNNNNKNIGVLKSEINGVSQKKRNVNEVFTIQTICADYKNLTEQVLVNLKDWQEQNFKNSDEATEFVLSVSNVLYKFWNVVYKEEINDLKLYSNQNYAIDHRKIVAGIDQQGEITIVDKIIQNLNSKYKDLIEQANKDDQDVQTIIEDSVRINLYIATMKPIIILLEPEVGDLFDPIYHQNLGDSNKQYITEIISPGLVSNRVVLVEARVIC